MEGTRWSVVWEPSPQALGIALTGGGAILPPEQLHVVRGSQKSRVCGLVGDWRVQDAQDLDFERLIRTVIATHTRAIFREFALRLQHTPVFSLPGAVRVVEEGTRAGIYTRVVSLISDCK